MSKNNNSYPCIAITPGEPASIGPDICLQLAQQPLAAELVFIADPELLSQRANQLNLTCHMEDWQHPTGRTQQPGNMFVKPISRAYANHCGELKTENADYVLATIKEAALGCLTKKYDAMVTGPIQKSIINEAGIPFSGHTEFIAELTQSNHPVMMLATQGLRVALVTTHLPVAEISQHITQQNITHTLQQLQQGLIRYFGIQQPNIYVCGLNPHAGEQGHLGREEIEIIEPALHQLREQGMKLYGPFAADTIFTAKYMDQADVILAMYHDQGLPVLKYKGFGQAINVTLGLPIIRTSVDHGTALELAGTGQASPASLQLAVTTAMNMVNQVNS